jgi:heptosyltransferase-2
LRTDGANLTRLFDKLHLQGGGAVALLPGAEYGPAKQWPIAHWAALARRLVEAGRPVWLLGSQRDHAAAEQIIKQARAAEGLHNLCGVTSLVDAVDLLSVCAAAVSNDSGLMHVAAAVGITVVGIYGSSTPDYTPPLSDKAQVLYQRLDCSPCFKRECPLGHTHCLTQIEPEQIWDSLQQCMPPIPVHRES